MGLLRTYSTKTETRYKAFVEEAKREKGYGWNCVDYGKHIV